MKSTPFIEFHKTAGARMVPFAGYEMPVEFSGINDEHLTVREKVGVFDVSHMGEFIVSGKGAEEFLQYITTNDVSSIYDGKIQYTCFPNGRGGIVDDFLIYRISSDRFLLVVNAANTEKDWNWCLLNADKFGLKAGRDLINISDDIAQLAVQGPLASKALQKLCSEDINGMEYYTLKNLEFAGIKDVLISATGYTGAGGFEIYVKKSEAAGLWNSVFEAGKEFGIKPVGLGARDTLRLEMGYTLYGNDLDDTTSPIEAGLGWIVKFNKDFIDKDLLLKQKQEGVDRKLKGFVMVDRGIPRQHYEVVDSYGSPIGEVTSGTVSPLLKNGIGMAYLSKGYWDEGTEILIRIRDRQLKAKVAKIPFIGR